MQRRTLLRAATAGAAAAAVSAPAPARAWAPPKPPSETTQARRLAVRERLTPTPAKHHLLLRTTYGITPALLAELDARGTRGWLDDQLTPERIDDGACDQIVARFPLASATPPELYRALDNGSWDGMRDVSSMTLARATWSKRQLFEVMVEFWSNHLNVTCPSSEVWSSRGSYDRDVIRKHALGTFSDLLVASCTHPAMLQYLDNLESRGANPNENYGREVLELHTVGRDAGYGQAGVVDSARAFTGLTVWNPWNGGTDATHGTLRYRADWHYVGPLRVLGWSHPNADRTQGVQVATSLARYLAAHPATAARLAHKLAVRFVSDSPPPALVDRLAQTYLDSGTAIVPVLRALFASPEFAASTGQKYRRPYEDVVATLRTLGIQTTGDTQAGAFSGLVWQLGEIGHAPLAWHPPDGYPDVAAAWAGTGAVLGRWNLHVGLAQGWWKDGLAYPGASLFDRLLPGPRPATRADLVTALQVRLMPGTPLPAAHRDALVTFLGGPGPVRDADVTWQFGILTAIMLDSPLWSTR